MKIKFNVARSGTIISFKKDSATLQEALDLLQHDEVISITVTKQTPAQYLKAFNSSKKKDNNGSV